MFVTKIGCIAVSNVAAPTGPTLVFDLADIQALHATYKARFGY